MNILLLASHAVAEYDDLRMFTDLGYDVFAPGGYENPSRSGEGIRPALPDAPHHPEFVALCQRQREVGGEPGPYIDWAKANLHPDIIDWADVIIVHHFPEVWIGAQWERIKHKRVIWRTCGQSNPELERLMSGFRGLQIVRYSPKERIGFGEDFAGEDALIRFGKYPDDYGPWVGDIPAVINITQRMAQRGDACGYWFWQDATRGLARWFDEGPEPPWAIPLGEGSEAIGGAGLLTYQQMLLWLRRARVYLYTGTRPASYTLGLIEAALSGIPIVSIGPEAFGVPGLFEGHEFASDGPFDDPARARVAIDRYFSATDEDAAVAGRLTRDRAIATFGIETVGPQWVRFLS